MNIVSSYIDSAHDIRTLTIHQTLVVNHKMRATDFVGFLLAVAFSPRLGRAKTVLLPGSSGLYGTPIFRPLTCQAVSLWYMYALAGRFIEMAQTT